MVLGKGAEIAIVDADDWKTKAAKEAREEARAAGKTPLLRKHHDKLERMKRLAFEELDRLDGLPNPLRDPELDREVSVVWEQDGILNRLRVDILDRQRRIAWDLKTCAGLAAPENWLRTSMDHGADLRAAQYLDGLEATFGGTWRYVFLIVEKDAPHCASLATISPNGLWIGRQKIEIARSGWRRCLRADHWPGHPIEVAVVEPPEFMTNRWVAQAEAQDARFKPKPTDAAKAQAYAMQRPTL
jgi:hypothetical protein